MRFCLLHQVPKAFLKDAHHWLILHGRYYTCTARNPKCPECGISDSNPGSPGIPHTSVKTQYFQGDWKILK